MPEKHICVSLGTYELEIGVARFPDTSVFEIIYVQDPPPLLFQNIRDAPQSSQPSYSVAPAITEATLAQVNALASTNPRVAELIQLAHTNRATPDQLRELGHSVNHIVSAQTPAGPTDMVIEFRERPGQRRVIPKEHAFLEARTPENTLVVKTVLTDSYRNSEPITITLRHASPDIRRFVARWVGAEDQEPRKRKWQTLVRMAGRMMLVALSSRCSRPKSVTEKAGFSSTSSRAERCTWPYAGFVHTAYYVLRASYFHRRVSPSIRWKASTRRRFGEQLLFAVLPQSSRLLGRRPPTKAKIGLSKRHRQLKLRRSPQRSDARATHLLHPRRQYRYQDRRLLEERHRISSASAVIGRVFLSTAEAVRVLVALRCNIC
jgi:hypothetical protein